MFSFTENPTKHKNMGIILRVKKKIFDRFLEKWLKATNNKAERYGIFYEKIWERFRELMEMPSLIDIYDWQSEYHVFFDDLKGTKLRTLFRLNKLTVKDIIAIIKKCITLLTPEEKEFLYYFGDR